MNCFEYKSRQGTYNQIHGTAHTENTRALVLRHLEKEIRNGLTP